MLKGLEKQFEMLLEHTSPVNDRLIEVIATAELCIIKSA
ncbi:sister chromatid cohesion protein PDS5-like A-like [Trifolium medium]|uniref:Sister chromatid cohesion protein PDS5-like A-like n=1 Tax=Trifolium medium TaxID=97028 RepID=A0A392MYV0_9FABA|nr:sister chromatid cohesion protein PDS5-like A-like [Trifolium medium]